jgi:hypothetical protein
MSSFSSVCRSACHVTGASEHARSIRLVRGMAEWHALVQCVSQCIQRSGVTVCEVSSVACSSSVCAKCSSTLLVLRGEQTRWCIKKIKTVRQEEFEGIIN